MSRQGKRRKRTLENVKDFWHREAQEWGENPQVTIRDHYFRMLGMEVVVELIKGRCKVLDIGCGTGFSTLFYGEVVGEIIGADYTADMITIARRFLDDPSYYEQVMEHYSPDHRPALRGNVRFAHGDILGLDYPAGSFDAVIAERVLVNLPTRDLQDKAVAEVARVLSPGGVWILAEASEQGHKCIDGFRQMFGLPVLEKYWHNLYVDEAHLELVLERMGFSIRELRRFETYQFLTKVIHPHIVAPEEPQFFAGINKAAWIVSREYPDYQSIMRIGLQPFLQDVFRPLLAQYDPTKLTKYDQIVTEIVHINPDFTGCSHQVLFVLDRLDSNPA